jgi:NaMN:DMB phosphoribosyltransferase
MRSWSPEQLAALVESAAPADTLLVDDLGGWLTALLATPEPDARTRAASISDAVAAVAAALAATSARVVIVSPEVGLSVVPATPLGRTFADALGSTNRAVAAACDAVALIVAGRPVWLREEPRTAAYVPGTVVEFEPPATPAAMPVEATPDTTDEEVDELRVGMSLPLPDDDAVAEATRRIQRLPVPGAGLAGLGTAVTFAAGTRGTATPTPYASVRVVVIGAEHTGAIADGDSADDWAVRHGPDGALRRLGYTTRDAGTSIEFVHAGTAAPIEAGDVCSDDDRDRAMRRGWQIANAAADRGNDLLVIAAGGPGLDAAATALVAGITRIEVPSLLGRVYRLDGEIDDAAWMRRCTAIRDALLAARDRVPDGPTMLSVVGGPGLALATGLLLGAVARRTAVVLDGPVGAAAALAARDWAAQVRLWCLLTDIAGDPTVRAAADRLGVSPLFSVGLGLGEGANALALLPTIQAALAIGAMGDAGA